jgi:hypothetical protein
MKSRIAICAGLGALVVVLWSVYLSAAFITPRGFVAVLLDLTCPIALVRQYPMSVYFVLVVNAATYALAAAVVETMRRHYRPRLLSN